MRAVIYARYSTDLQSEASIEDQVRLCTARIEREGWRLVETYADRATSGASTLRPGYQRMLRDAQAGRFDVVIAEALDRATACARFSLPPDREGDVAVIAERGAVIGGASRDHDLSALRGERLRSHGGTSEARVPFILNVPVNAAYRAQAEAGIDSWRIFDFALNGAD